MWFIHLPVFFFLSVLLVVTTSVKAQPAPQSSSDLESSYCPGGGDGVNISSGSSFGYVFVGIGKNNGNGKQIVTSAVPAGFNGQPMPAAATAEGSSSSSSSTRSGNQWSEIDFPLAQGARVIDLFHCSLAAFPPPNSHADGCVALISSGNGKVGGAFLFKFLAADGSAAKIIQLPSNEAQVVTMNNDLFEISTIAFFTTGTQTVTVRTVKRHERSSSNSQRVLELVHAGNGSTRCRTTTAGSNSSALSSASSSHDEQQLVSFHEFRPVWLWHALLAVFSPSRREISFFNQSCARVSKIQLPGDLGGAGQKMVLGVLQYRSGKEWEDAHPAATNTSIDLPEKPAKRGLFLTACNVSSSSSSCSLLRLAVTNESSIILWRRDRLPPELRLSSIRQVDEKTIAIFANSTTTDTFLFAGRLIFLDLNTGAVRLTYNVPAVALGVNAVEMATCESTLFAVCTGAIALSVGSPASSSSFSSSASASPILLLGEYDSRKNTLFFAPNCITLASSQAAAAAAATSVACAPGSLKIVPLGSTWSAVCGTPHGIATWRLTADIQVVGGTAAAAALVPAPVCKAWVQMANFGPPIINTAVQLERFQAQKSASGGSNTSFFPSPVVRVIFADQAGTVSRNSMTATGTATSVSQREELRITTYLFFIVACSAILFFCVLRKFRSCAGV